MVLLTDVVTERCMSPLQHQHLNAGIDMPEGECDLLQCDVASGVTFFS